MTERLNESMPTLVEVFKQKYEDMSIGIDPTIDGWLLMKTAGPLFGILGLYLMFVLKIGPYVMQNRKPYNIQRLLVLYNAFQIVFCTWICFKLLSTGKLYLKIFNNGSDSQYRQFSLEFWSASWWYFFSKIIDLLDTVFFVLKKKQNQITFLHVYHHSNIILFTWGYLKYLPGEQGIVIGALNSFVHIIMYFYYMLAAMGPKYQKYLWWKKYMTWIQLIQFSLMLFYFVYITIMDFKLPKSLTFLFFGNTAVFLYLFVNFYRKAYKTQGKNAAKNKDVKELYQNYECANNKPIKVD